MEKFALGHPNYSNYTKNWKGYIDWILYTPKTVKLLKILKIPSTKLLSLDGESLQDLDLPNRLYPSDHLRIEAVFEFIEIEAPEIVISDADKLRN
jgi:CCR4-NOT transcription complex subunit 6